jgi:hypothetical protein
LIALEKSAIVDCAGIGHSLRRSPVFFTLTPSVLKRAG